MNKRLIYCWFGGGEMDVVSKACLQSWIRVMPDYELMRIDENIFDVNMYPNCKELYACGKYAYVSDIARVWALATYGGIYLDTDVYALKSFDSLLSLNTFMGVLPNGHPNIGVIGGKEYWSTILNEYAEMGEKFTSLGAYLLRRKKLAGKRIFEVDNSLNCTLIPDSMFYAREFVPAAVPSTAYNVHLFNCKSMSAGFVEAYTSENYLHDYLLN